MALEAVPATSGNEKRDAYDVQQAVAELASGRSQLPTTEALLPDYGRH
jgi:hypothetical protein